MNINNLGHNNHIPVWGLINFQLLYQLHLSISDGKNQKTSIQQLIKNTSKHLGCSPHLSDYWSPINAGTVFSFLYSVIVVPKELFSDNPEKLLNTFPVEVTDVFVSVDFGNEKLNSPGKIIRFLRNSISHVNYEIDNQNSSLVSMWNNFNGNINIQVQTDINKLANFGVKFAQYFAKSHLN